LQIADGPLQIADCSFADWGMSIGDFAAPNSLRNPENPQSAIDPQSAICTGQAAICNLQSAICNLQFAICNLQSAIRDLKSAID